MGRPFGATGAPAALAPSTPTTLTSTAPVYSSLAVRHRPARKFGRGVLWVVGLILLLGLGFTGFVVVMKKTNAEQRRKDMAANAERESEARHAYRHARKKARERVAELEGAYRKCVSAEEQIAVTAFNAAVVGGAFEGGDVRPTDKSQLVKAVAYVKPEGGPLQLAFAADKNEEWIPASPWVSRGASSCPSVPKGVKTIEHWLQQSVPKDAYSLTRFYKENRDHLVELTDAIAALESAGEPKVPSALVVASQTCDYRVVSSYDSSDRSDKIVDLKSYTCATSLTWIDRAGKRLARVVGSGRARPSEVPKLALVRQLGHLNGTTRTNAETASTKRVRVILEKWSQ